MRTGFLLQETKSWRIIYLSQQIWSKSAETANYRGRRIIRVREVIKMLIIWSTPKHCLVVCYQCNYFWFPTHWPCSALSNKESMSTCFFTASSNIIPMCINEFENWKCSFSQWNLGMNLNLDYIGFTEISILVLDFLLTNQVWISKFIVSWITFEPFSITIQDHKKSMLILSRYFIRQGFLWTSQDYGLV